MKLVRIMAIAALAAGVSTAAQAGGYSFQSIGGNLGKWAYGDAAAHGDATVNGRKTGGTYSRSYAHNKAKTKHKISGNVSIGCGFCVSGNIQQTKKAEDKAYSHNYSGFSAPYGGLGSAQSHSGAVAGSGAGHGDGYKFGSFAPRPNPISPYGGSQ